MTENRSKTDIKEVRVAGGGSQSDAICQITSDIFNKPVRRGELFEATALGNAMVGMVGMKIHNDFNSANKEMLRLSTGFEPQRRNADLYKDIYYKVYKKMYRKLKPLFKKLKDIFEDYPESTI